MVSSEELLLRNLCGQQLKFGADVEASLPVNHDLFYKSASPSHLSETRRMDIVTLVIRRNRVN